MRTFLIVFFITMCSGFFIWRGCYEGYFYPAISHHVWENDDILPNGVSTYIRVHGEIVWSANTRNKELKSNWVEAEKKRQIVLAKTWISYLEEGKFEIPTPVNLIAGESPGQQVPVDESVYASVVQRKSRVYNPIGFRIETEVWVGKKQHDPAFTQVVEFFTIRASKENVEKVALDEIKKAQRFADRTNVELRKAGLQKD